MFKYFKTRFPTWFNFIVAGAAALFVWLSSHWLSGEYLWMRMCFGAATVLVFVEVIETHYIARGSAGFKSLSFWNHAFFIGYQWTFLMILFMWSGMEKLVEQLSIYGVAGMFFGISMAYLSKFDKEDIVITRYKLDDAGLNDRWTEYFKKYSALIIIFTLGVMFFIKKNDLSTSNPVVILWFILIMGGMLTAFNRKPVAYFRISERYIGFLLCVVAFWFFY